MTSWILTVSYLWKDTWKRWFEQPGSLLARSVVTVIMVGLAVVLLVGFRMQVESVRQQVEAFGLQNIIIQETMSAEDVAAGVTTDRFRDLSRFGELFTGRVVSATAQGDSGRRARIVTYTDADIPGLLPYLRYGYEIFVVSAELPPGLVSDYQLRETSFKAVALPPEERFDLVFNDDVLFIPSSRAAALERNGFAMLYFFERAATAPPVGEISAAVMRVAQSDKRGQIELRNAENLLEQLEAMQAQQNRLRFWLGLILGSALALVYGVLSVLEFRQSLYVSALLRSFGVSSVFLGLRTIFENALIVNAITFLVIYMLSAQHETLFGALRVETTDDLSALYWGTETLWIFIAANVGILISSLPVFWALRRPIGEILE